MSQSPPCGKHVMLGSAAIIASELKGGGGLTKTGFGTLVLPNANSYTGATNINLGAVVIRNAGSLGADASTVNVNGTATVGTGGRQLVIGGGLGAAGITLARNLGLSGGGPTGGGVAFNSVGDNTVSGSIVTASTVTTRLASSFGATTLSGPITVGAGQTTLLGGNAHWNLTGGLTVGSTASTVFEKGGPGTLVLGGTNSIAGELRLSGGGFLRLAAGTGGTLSANQGSNIPGAIEIRTDNASSFNTTKILFRATSTYFADRAVGSTAGLINQTVVFSDSTHSTNNNTTQTFAGRNGYGITLTGVGGPTGNITLPTGNTNLATYTNSLNGLLTFDANFRETDSTGRNLTFGGSGDTLITGSYNATGGAHAVIKSGSGTLTINGTASVHTGATTINAGTLAIRTFGALNASGAGALNIGNATTTAGTLNYFGTVGAGAKTLTLRGVSTDANLISSNLANQGANVLSLTKDQSGTWVLSGSNGSMTGAVAVSSGSLGVGSNNALGTGTVTFTGSQMFAYGGDRSLANAVTSNNTTVAYIGSNSLAFGGALTVNVGGSTTINNSITAAGKTLTFSGQVNLNDGTNARTLTLTGGGTTILSGKVASNAVTVANNITLNAPGGTLVLGNAAGTNDYTGNTTLTQGTLRLTQNNQIPDGSTSGNVTINPAAGQTATLDIAGVSDTINGLTATTAGGTTIIDNSSASPASLTFGNNNVAVSIGAATGTFQIKNTGGGALSIIKTGTAAGTIAANTSLTYTGATSVIGTGAMTISAPVTATNALNVSGGGTLNLPGGLTAPGLVTGVSVGGASTLNLVNNAAAPFPNLTSLSLGVGGSATFNLEMGAPANAELFTSSGAATTANTVTLNLWALPGFGSSSTYNVFSAPSGLSGATYALGLKPAGYSYDLVTNSTDSLIRMDLTAAPISLYWRGGVSASWAGTSGLTTNWATDAAGTLTGTGLLPGPLATLVFSATGATGPAISTTLDQSFVAHDMQFIAAPTGVTSVTIAQGSMANRVLTLAPTTSTVGIDVADNAGAVTILAPLVVGANQTWSATGTGANGSSLTVSGALSGSADVTKSGAGGVIISGDLSGYTGTFKLNQGSLSFRSNGGTTPQLITFGPGNGSNVSVIGDATLDVTRVGANTGHLIGLGGLTIGGGKNLTITGATGSAGANAATPSFAVVFNGASSITGNATFTLGTSAAVSAPITLAGTVTATAGSTISVTGPTPAQQHSVLRLTNTSSATPNSFTGSTFSVNAGGTLEARAAVGGVDDGTSSLAGGTVTLNGGTLKITPQFNTAIAGSAGFLARYWNGNPPGQYLASSSATSDLSTFNYLAAPTGSNTTGVVNAPNNGSGLTPGAGMTALPGGVNLSSVTALFTGVLNITTAGYYGFNSASDDGSQLFIDGTLVVNNNGNHSFGGQMPWGAVYLTAGSHAIAQRYYNGTGGGGDVLSYSGPDTANATVLVGSISGSVITPATAPSMAFSTPITLQSGAVSTLASTIDLGADTTIPTLTTTTGAGGATLTITSSSLSTLTVAGGITLLSNLTLNPNLSGHVTLAGIVSDGGGGFGITKTGSGTAILNGTNTYGGITTITGGILQTGNTQGLGTNATAVAVTLNGGQLNLRQDGSATFGPAPATAYNLTVAANSTIDLDRATGGGPAGGTLALGPVSLGAFNLTLSNGNAYNLNLGAVTATDAGTITTNFVGGLATLASLGLNNAAAKSVTIAGTGNTAITGAVTQTGGGALTLVKAGNTTLTLNGAGATYTGGTTLQQGIIVTGATNALGNAPLTLGSGTNVVTLDTNGQNATVSALSAVSNSATANQIINLSGTLNVEDLVSTGNVFRVGSGTAVNTRLDITGTGTGKLNVNAPLGLFKMQTNNGGAGGLAELYLTGLPQFTANVGTFLLGSPSSADSFGVASKQMVYLGPSSVITATNAYISTGNNNGGQLSSVVMGQDVVMNVDNFDIARYKGDGSVYFAAGLTNPKLTIRGKAGDPSTAILIVGNKGTSTAMNRFGTLDLTAAGGTQSSGILDAKLGTLTIGSVTNGNDGAMSGVMSFDHPASVISAGTVNISLNTQNLTGVGGDNAAAGTLNMGGGTMTVNTAFTIASKTGTAASTGIFNLTGGVATLNCNLNDGGGVSTLNLAGGTLDMTGRSIGVTNPIDTITLASGTLKNVVQINGGTGTMTKSTAGTFTLDGACTFSNTLVLGAGTVVMGNSGVLQNATVDTTGTGVINFGTATNVTFAALGGSGSMALINNTPAPIALTVGGNNANTMFSGVLSGAGASLTKTGTGTMAIGGTAGAVTFPTLNLNGGALVVGDNLTPANNNGGILLAGTGSALLTNGTLTSGDGTAAAELVVSVFNSDATFDANLVVANNGSSVVSLTKSGLAGLIVKGANTYTGATTIVQGFVRAESNTALGSSAGATTVLNRASLVINTSGGAIAEPLTLNGAGTGTVDGALNNLANANSLSGAITQASASRIVSTAGTLTLTGGVSGAFDLNLGGAGNTTVETGVLAIGAGNLTKDGAGTLEIRSASTYTGNTYVNAGTVLARNSAAPGTGGTIYVASGAALAIDNDTATNAVTISRPIMLYGTGVGGAGAISAADSNAKTNVISSTITLGSDARINNASGTLNITATSAIVGSGRSLTLGGSGNTNVTGHVILGTGALTKDGAGTLFLSGVNEWTGGTNLNEGILRIRRPDSLGGTGRNLNIAAGAAAIVDFAAMTSGAPIGNMQQMVNRAATGAAGPLLHLGNLSENLDFSLSGGTTAFFGLAVPLGYNATNGGQPSTTATTGASAVYTGTLTPQGGTVRLSNYNAWLLNTQNAIAGAASLIAGGTAAGTVFINSTQDYTGGTTLNKGLLAVNTLADGGADSGIGKSAVAAGNLVFAGGGTQTLSGVNTYSGNTTVSAGTLVAQQGVNGGPTTATTSVTASGAKLEAKSIRQNVLSIVAGATAEITTNPTATDKAATVSVLTSALAAPNNSLQIAAGGVFDLNNNDLVAYYTPGTGAASLSTMQQYIYDGYLNTPSVPQIKADTSLGTFQTYAVAFDSAALAVPKTTWDGQPLSGTNQIIVKYTYRGDLDLNGVVDGNDFTVVQMYFGLTGLGLGKGWMKGDADLDGDVDGNDFTVIQANFGGGSGGALAPPVGNAVPEPSTLALALVAGLAALGAALRRFWRRKR